MSIDKQRVTEADDLAVLDPSKLDEYVAELHEDILNFECGHPMPTQHDTEADEE